MTGSGFLKNFKKVFVSMLIITALFTGHISAADSVASNYKDVKETDWFAESVGKLDVLKVIDGLPDGSFNPQGEITRAQFVKMLVQAVEYKKIDDVSFTDMKPYPSSKPHWASVYVETALRNKVIIKSEEGDKFYPDVPLTREDMVMMMFRALKLESSDGANPYYDLVEPNGYFTKLYEEYLVRGIPMNGKIIFNPTGVTTRAQASVIIARLVDYKADPEGFAAKAAMEERFANGTQTAEDIALKRELEIEKAKADPNYIMEPEIRILNTRADFDGYGDIADAAYSLHAGYITIGNYDDYTADLQVKIVCIDKGKDLINTGTLLTQPFISYDHVYEVRRDVWEPLKRAYNEELDTHVICAIFRDEEKAVNGKWTKVPNYVKEGETLNFKLYLKRGTNTEVYDIKFKVN